jgi:hypothetical protein
MSRRPVSLAVFSFVIPAKAGIQAASVTRTSSEWTPAFAGVTGER